MMASRWPTLLLLALLIVLAGFVVRDANIATEDRDAGAPFAVIPASDAQQAPDFMLHTTSGNTVKLSDEVKHGPVLLDFWAIWCKPCNMELPQLASVGRKYQALGVTFNGINSDAPAARINQFFSKENVGFPMLVDKGGSVAGMYGITSIPVVLVVDRNMMVRSMDDGYDPNTQRDLSRCLDTLLKE